MNFSRRTAKKSKVKLFLEWVFAILAVCVFVFGAWSLFDKAFAADVDKDTGETIEAVETPSVASYGTPDGRSFATTEVSLDWAVDDEFEPLNVPLDEEIQEFVYYLSKGYCVDWLFVMAIIQQESNYQADAISTTNDYGLMQINKINHEYITETIGVTDFLDPYQNVRAGLWIIRNLFEKYDDPCMVLMAYNMGEAGAAVLWDQGIYETNYSKSVLTIQEELQRSVNHD